MTFMRLLGLEKSKNVSPRQIFLDEAAYAKEIDSIAIETAGRIARGGVALQMMDVITEKQFHDEMAALKRDVEASDCI